MAILLVILAHVRTSSPQAGLVGVTAFFVLSGYLITKLLVAEREKARTISVRGFYRRRIARLAPALALLLVFVVVTGVSGWWPTTWITGTVASVLYVGNWYRVAGLDLMPLGHVWSLAVEEQFYLAWPLLILVLGRKVWTVAVAGITLAVVGRAVLTPELAYFDTFTRIDAIFAGCLLALWDVRLPRSVGVAGIVLLGIAALSTNADAELLPLATVASVMILAGRAPLVPLAAVGRRAYGIYLWHLPLIYLFGPAGVPATFIVAEASYRLLERPIIGRARQLPATRSASAPA